MELFDSVIFDEDIFDVGTVSTLAPVRGHLIKRPKRGRRKICYWDDIEKCNQEQIEEAAIEIIKEEQKVDKEILVAEQTKLVVKNQIKLKQLQKKIVDLEQEQVYLQQQKELVLKQIELLNEEDDLEAILMML